MKKIVLLLYLLILIACISLIVVMNLGPEVKLVAARALPAHHLFMPGDLQLKVNGRQYLPRPLKEGQTIDSGEIRMLSDIVTSAGEIPVAVTIGRDKMIARDIDPGDGILLCPPNVPAVVRAAVCGDPGSPCIVVVTVAVIDAKKLKSATAQELSLLEDDTCK